MQMTLKEIADFLGCRLIGDESLVISGIASLESAGSGDLTFATEHKYLQRMESSSAGAFIVTEALSAIIKDKNLIISDNPYYSLSLLLKQYYRREKRPMGIDKNVIIAKTATVSESASIYPNVFIDAGAVIKDGAVIYPGCFIGENVIIGRDTLLYPNVVVREDCVIGNNVIIHSGTVIGSDGFGYVLHNGKQNKIPQIGKVIIEDDVEIGANVAIDRAALGETVIGAGTKLDNLVQIAHNVKIGKDCVIAAQVGIAGSTKLGDRVAMAGQAGVVGHVKIGDNVIITGKCGVTNHIKDGEVVAGFPAIESNKWRKNAVLINKLPDMRKKIAELEKKIKELEKKN